MTPIVATIGTGDGRQFSVEVIINYEVIADHRVSDLFPSKMANSFFGEPAKAVRKIGKLFAQYGPDLIDMGKKALSFI